MKKRVLLVTVLALLLVVAIAGVAAATPSSGWVVQQREVRLVNGTATFTAVWRGTGTTPQVVTVCTRSREEAQTARVFTYFEDGKLKIAVTPRFDIEKGVKVSLLFRTLARPSRSWQVVSQELPVLIYQKR